jgi:hypothetical protein
MQVRDGAPCADGVEQDDGASAAIEEGWELGWESHGGGCGGDGAAEEGGGCDELDEGVDEGAGGGEEGRGGGEGEAEYGEGHGCCSGGKSVEDFTARELLSVDKS